MSGTADSRQAAERRQTIRDFLHKRYNGVIPVTDEMIDAVLAEMNEADAE